MEKTVTKPECLFVDYVHVKGASETYKLAKLAENLFDNSFSC